MGVENCYFPCFVSQAALERHRMWRELRGAAPRVGDDAQALAHALQVRTAPPRRRRRRRRRARAARGGGRARPHASRPGTRRRSRASSCARARPRAQTPALPTGTVVGSQHHAIYFVERQRGAAMVLSRAILPERTYDTEELASA